MCVNKDRKDVLHFICSDTKWSAKGTYYKNLDKFINDENIQHIEYHEHSYIIKNNLEINIIIMIFIKKIFLQIIS